MAKILLVDDDDHIRELIRLFLIDEGFDIVEQTNGVDALDYARIHKVDLAILDIMMPNMDGWELFSMLREISDIPILITSAKGESTDQINGLKLGTFDYLVKPFDPMELVLRVKTLLNRYGISTLQGIKLGNITLDRKNYQVIFPDGQKLSLPMKEFELLYKLGSSPGHLFSRENLIRYIWGNEYKGDWRTVDVHIKRLRERFAEVESEFRIVTIRGLGYRLEI